MKVKYLKKYQELGEELYDWSNDLVQIVLDTFPEYFEHANFNSSSGFYIDSYHDYDENSETPITIVVQCVSTSELFNLKLNVITFQSKIALRNEMKNFLMNIKLKVKKKKKNLMIRMI